MTDAARFLKDGRQKIQLPGSGRLLSEFATELGQSLSVANVFSRGGTVFTVDDGLAALVPVSKATLRTLVEEHTVCYYVRKTGSGDVIELNRTMSEGDASGVLASPQFIDALRPVERLNTVRMPVRRDDGYIELLPEGYDAQSRTFTMSGGPPIATLPVEVACQTLKELFSEFGFADDGRSLAVTLSAMFTVYGYGILPKGSLRPCFIVLANAEGAGKTLLVKCATVPVMGFTPTGSKPSSEDEVRKIILSAVIEGKQVILFDNFKGHFNSDSLEGFLTSQHWSGRILGGNRSFTGENNSTVFITGNGTTITPDMRRRSLFIELFMEAERAEDRKFKQALEVPQLLERRGDILSALWSLIKDWNEYMEPGPSHTNASFHEWGRIIGGIVEHAGFKCPLERHVSEAAADKDGEDMRALVNKIADGALFKSVKFCDVVETAAGEGLFEWVLGGDPEAMGPKQKNQLSKLLGRYDRRMVGGYRFNLSGKGHARRYEVTKV